MTLFSIITGITHVRTTTKEALADSAIISFVAMSNALVAKVWKLKGRKIRVKGNSFKISTKANKTAAAMLFRINGRSTFHRVRAGEAPKDRATSLTDAPVYWNPASIALYPTAIKRTI